MSEVLTLLGLDVGTSSIKAALLDRDGVSLVVRSVPTPFRSSSGGTTEMSVPDLFGAVDELLRLLAPWLPSVGGVGVASIGESGGWVQDGQIADVPMLAWHDSRGEATTARLIQAFGRPELLRRTGRRSRVATTVSHLGWLADQGTRPGGVWTGVAGLLVWRLTGNLAQEPALAATSGAYDPFAQAYDEDILAAVDLEVNWAPVTPAGTPVGYVTQQQSARTGLVAGIPVTIAGHDHPVGVLGAGGRPGMVVDSMGTGEPLLAAWSGGAPATHPELPGTSGDLTFTSWPGEDLLMVLWEHLRPGLGLRALATLLDVPRDQIERAAREQPPHRPMSAQQLSELEDGTVRPEDLAARGAMDPARVWADALDGYAAVASAAEQELRQLTGSTGPTLLIGGGVRSHRWVSAKQQLQTHGLVVADDQDSVARGAALLAGAAAGWWSAQHLPRLAGTRDSVPTSDLEASR